MSEPDASLFVGARIWAVFKPKRTDDLKADALRYVGRTGQFEAYWKIDDGDYAGQWAMKVPANWDVTSFFWVPESDLEPALGCGGPAYGIGADGRPVGWAGQYLVEVSPGNFRLRSRAWLTRREAEHRLSS